MRRETTIPPLGNKTQKMFYFIKENAQLQKESHQSLSSSMVGKEQRGTRRGDAPELNPAQSSYISMVMNQLQLIVKTARPPPFLWPQVLHCLYGQRSPTSLWLRVLHLYGIKSSTVSMVTSPPCHRHCKPSSSSAVRSVLQELHSLYDHSDISPTGNHSNKEAQGSAVSTASNQSQALLQTLYPLTAPLCGPQSSSSFPSIPLGAAHSCSHWLRLRRNSSRWRRCSTWRPWGSLSSARRCGAATQGAELSFYQGPFHRHKGEFGPLLGSLTQLGGDGGSCGLGAGSQDGVQDAAAIAVTGQGQEVAL